MPIEYICDNCGEIDSKSRSKLKRSKRNFCSNKCKHEYFRKNPEIMSDQKKRIL